jgi:undecaprenyl-diphosphatase
MTAASRLRGPITLLAYAVVAFALFLYDGFTLARRSPGLIDVRALALLGHGVPLALFFTKAGLFPVFAVLCVLLLIFGFVRRRYLPLVAVPVVALILAWKTSDAFKEFFHRPRPEHWLAIHETSASYPSGHAVLSSTFYGLLAYIVWRTWPAGPQRSIVIGLAMFWILATGWSRLALGAHYASDVLGGYLLGAVFWQLGVIVVDRILANRQTATYVAVESPPEVFVRDESPA